MTPRPSRSVAAARVGTPPFGPAKNRCVLLPSWDPPRASRCEAQAGPRAGSRASPETRRPPRNAPHATPRLRRPGRPARRQPCIARDAASLAILRPGDPRMVAERGGADQDLELALEIGDRLAVEMPEEEPGEDVQHDTGEKEHERDRQHPAEEVGERQPPADLVEEGAGRLPAEAERSE